MKYIFVFLLFNILCVSLSVAQEKIPLADNMNFTECKISDYASSVKYLPLETSDECLLSGELQMYATSQYIFVHDQIEYKVYRFDATTGKYLNMIGKRGQGPGEYVRLLGFYVDDIEKKCFLLCNTGSIYVYDYEGAFIKKIGLPNSYFPSRMERIGNYYVLDNILYLDTKKELCLLDLQGKVIKEKTLSHKDKIGFMIPTAYFYKQDGLCYYKNDLSENMYLIDEKLNLKPVYWIDCGRKTINTKDDQVDKTGRLLVKDRIILGRISGYKNNVYIPYFVNNKCFVAIYNIKTGSVITAGKNQKPGFTDNLANGPMILPPTRTSLFLSSVPNQLISWFYPSDIDATQYPNGEFRKTAEQLNEDSNPLIRIIHLK